MEAVRRKGAGYSIEVILSAVIIFTFAFGAVEPPDDENWSDLQNKVAANDISYVMKKTGLIDTALKNSNPGAIRTAATTISGRNLQVSGTVENLPLKQLKVGFHTMPDLVHKNFTEPVGSGDFCNGDLAEIDANSEYSVLKTKSEYLQNKHGVTLYFGDTDAKISGGYNGEKDYDALWVDNGTRCIFESSDGPFYLDQIFLWGNKTDSNPETHYDFKIFNDTSESFTLYRAEQAADFRKYLNRPLNSIETETSIDTFNFSSNVAERFNVVVFKEKNSLDRVSTYRDEFDRIIGNTSVLFLMNLSQSDLNRNIMQDIWFEWLDASYSSTSSSYEASFSDHSTSNQVETYFKGLKGSTEDLNLYPGGRVISSQGSSETSGNDLLYAKNVAYDKSDLNVQQIGGATDIGGNCGDDTRSDFDFPEGTYSVRNIQLKSSCSGSGVRALEIDDDGDSNFRGPFLEDEVLKVDGRRYVPRITDSDTAEFIFAGSTKVELVNYRESPEKMSGNRVARAAYESQYEQEDLKLLASAIYWLRGDELQFEAEGEPTSITTTVIGGLEENVFMPYKMDLRWAR